MKKLYVLFLCFLAFCATTHQVVGQNTRRAARGAMRAKSREMSKFTVKRNFGKSKQYASVGAFVGASNYYGDLAPRSRRFSTSIALTRTYLGAFYSKRINANFSWRASASWARLKGDDFNANRGTPEGEGRYRRNLNFRNDIVEAGAVAIGDIFPTDRGYLRRDFFNAYGFLGLSIFYHNPKGYVPKGVGLPGEGTWTPLRPLSTEGQGFEGYKKKYGLIQPALLLGMGVRYRVADKLDIGLEFGWRFTFTDYLDDVSSNYVNDKDGAKYYPDPVNNSQDRLWYVMSNKSGLRSGGSSDEVRQFDDKLPPNYELLQPDGTYLNGNGIATDVRRIKGYGVKDVLKRNEQTGLDEKVVDTGSPRGLKPNDGYTVTTLTAHYILEFRARTPKFR